MSYATIAVANPMFIEELDDMPEGFTAELLYDDSPENPREEYDHFATLVNLSKSTIDIDSDTEGIEDVIDHFLAYNERPRSKVNWSTFAWEYLGVKRGAMSPHDAEYMVRRYLSIFRDDIVHFEPRWHAGDSYGFGYVTRENARNIFGDEWTLEDVETLFGHEVREYAQWANGEVCGVVVTNDETGEEASCWGIYDDSIDQRYIREEANDLIGEVQA